MFAIKLLKQRRASGIFAKQKTVNAPRYSGTTRTAAMFGALALGLMGLLVLDTPNPASAATETIDTPGTHSWTVPDGVTSVNLTVRGGNSGHGSGSDRGKTGPITSGSNVHGTLEVSPGDKLTIIVATKGSNASATGPGAGGAGYTTGGTGGTGAGQGGHGGGGGGSSAVLLEDGTLMIVAGGGGGSGGGGYGASTDASAQENGGMGGGYTFGVGPQQGGSAVGPSVAEPGQGRGGSAGGTSGSSSTGNGLTGGGFHSAPNTGGGGGGGAGYLGGGGGTSGSPNGTSNTSVKGGGGGGAGQDFVNPVVTSASIGTTTGDAQVRITYVQPQQPVINLWVSQSNAVGTDVFGSYSVTNGTNVLPSSSGSVNIFVDDVLLTTTPLADLSGSIDFAIATAGQHTLRVEFVSIDTTNWLNASQSILFNVDKGNPTMNLHVRPLGGEIFGENITFTAVLHPHEPEKGGTVTFYRAAGANPDPANDLILGVRTITGPESVLTIRSSDFLNAGTHHFYAVFSGDDNFNATSALNFNGAYTVSKSDTSILELTTQLGFEFGEAVSVTVKVVLPSGDSLPNPSGSVTLKVLQGATEVGTNTALLDAQGQAVLAFPVVDPENYQYEITYSGSTNYNTSATTSRPIEVVMAGTVVIPDGEVRPVDPIFGQQMSWDVTVERVMTGSETPSGTVNLLVYSAEGVLLDTIPYVTDANGAVTLDLPQLAVGEYEVVAEFVGTNQFGGSQTERTPLSVSNAGTSSTLNIVDDNIAYGQPGELETTVAAHDPLLGPPTGTVEFYAGADLLGSALLDGDGKAKFLVEDLDVGLYSITARYVGEGNFSSSNTEEVSLEVRQAETEITVTADPGAHVYGEHLVTLTAIVETQAPAVGNPDGDVEFFIDGVSVGIGTVDAQQANLVINNGQLESILSGLHLLPGQFELHAKYLGSKNFMAAASASSDIEVTPSSPALGLTVTPNTINEGKSGTLSVTVGTPSNSPFADELPQGSIQFFVDGTSLDEPVAVTNGVAELVWKPTSSGKYVITAEFTSNNELYVDGVTDELILNVSAITGKVGDPKKSSLADSGIGAEIPLEIPVLLIMLGWAMHMVSRIRKKA